MMCKEFVLQRKILLSKEVEMEHLCLNWVQNLSDVGAALWCMQWHGCKIWECEEGEEERQSGEEEEERRCYNMGLPSPPTPRSFSSYPLSALSFVELHYRYPTCIIGPPFKSTIFNPNFFFLGNRF
jgi:hypothetical protein